MVYSKGGETTNTFNPFWSEGADEYLAWEFSPLDQETIPLPLSVPGVLGATSRSRISTAAGGGSGGNSSRGGRDNHGSDSFLTSPWNDEFFWRTEEEEPPNTTTTHTAMDPSGRVDTSISRSSYPLASSTTAAAPPPPMVDTSMESQPEGEDDEEDEYEYGYYGHDDDDQLHISSFPMESFRSFFPSSGTSQSLDRSTPTASHTSMTTTATTSPHLSILLKERLSILFDGLSPEPSCRVMGRIYVQHPSPKALPLSSASSTATNTAIPSSYQLVIHDRKRWVEQWTIQSESCREDVEAFTSFRHMSLQPTDRLFRIDTTTNKSGTRVSNSASGKMSPPEPTAILEYQCSTKLKPIPMLIKTKLQKSDRGKCHLGIRLRANPANRHDLERLAIVVVVPPHVQPNDPPPQGGKWDDVKRTLSWGCDALPPGQGMGLQITFQGGGTTDSWNDSPADHSSTCPFPILVHCRGYRLFSRLNVSAETMDGRPLNLDVRRVTTVLYRKL